MQINKIEQYLESKEVFCVISSKHKFSAHIGVIKKYGDLVTKSNLFSNCRNRTMLHPTVHPVRMNQVREKLTRL